MPVRCVVETASDGALIGYPSGQAGRGVSRRVECAEAESRELLHRYSATGGGRELSFVLQSSGGFDSHVPVAFVARRVVA